MIKEQVFSCRKDTKDSNRLQCDNKKNINFFLEQSQRDKTCEAQLTPYKATAAVWG